MEVAVHQFDGVSTLRALPLAAGVLVAAARAEPHLAREARFAIRSARIDPEAAAAACTGKDVLAFSSYVWNERYSLEVARRARARNPRAFILFGGPSVPRRPERATAYLRAHPAIDALVFGEGEQPFRELLKALLEGRADRLDSIAGLLLRDASQPGGARLTAPRKRLDDFAALASPYLDGTFDALFEQGANPSAAILETNRGCPFACTFCDWGQAIESSVEELPRQRLSDELAWIARRKIPYLYIVDANYGIRRRDLEIVRELGRLKQETGFPQYVFLHLTKNASERHLETVFALHEAGIGTTLALSSQDFDKQVLLAVKRDNIRQDRALHLRRLCHQRGIPTFNELILGLPEQTYASFASGLAKAVTPYPGDAFQLYLARVLENSEMGSPEYRARHGIETREVRIASFHQAGDPQPVQEVEEIVVATRTLPVDDWRRSFRLGYFLAAAHNLKLLDVVLQVALRAVRVELGALLEALVSALEAAAPGSVLGAISAALDRHAQAILDGDAMVLPLAGTGAHLWPVEDAVLISALGAAGRFYDEVAQALRERLPAESLELLEEAIRYQQFITPAPGAAARQGAFTRDFPAFCGLDDTAIAAGGESALARSPRALELFWMPAPDLAAARDLREFAIAYLAKVHARIRTGYVAPA